METLETFTPAPEFAADFELTVALPTYNSSSKILSAVQNILQCPHPRLEVVVFDNGSTDDTPQVLATIKDPRLFVYRNDVNKGPLESALKVMNHGRGQVILFSTDKDRVNVEELPAFIQFLRDNPEIAGGFCDHSSSSYKKPVFFNTGFEAVDNLAYKGRHPSGYFFKNDFLKKVKIFEKYSDYSVVDQFPFEFIFADIGLMGPGASYPGPLFTLETSKEAGARKSRATAGKPSDAYFAPAGRLRMTLNYVRHTQTLPMSLDQKTKLAANVFIYGLMNATLGYKAILKDQEISHHYHTVARNLGQAELAWIAVQFVAKFFWKLWFGKNPSVARKFVVTLQILLLMPASLVQGLIRKSRKRQGLQGA